MVRLTAPAILTIALGLAMPSQATAMTDSERIRLLESQLEKQKAMIEQQQKMLQSFEAELEKLKASTTEPVKKATTDDADEDSVLMADQPIDRPSDRVADADQDKHINVYGHIQLDTIYDFKRVDPDYNSTLRPSTIPTASGEFGSNGETIVSVKQTQLGFRGQLPSTLGPIKTWFEFDMFGTGGDAGETKFNLRHAWVEVGGLGFGQTNSNFMDIAIFPNVVDWWGPSGMAFNRNPQMRYTWWFGESDLAVALEKPNGSFNSGIFGELSPAFGAAAKDKTQYPDLTAHYRRVQDWGHVQLAGVLRELKFETRGTAGNRPKDSDLGWGLNLTSVINTVGKDQLKLGLVYGEGIASFMNDGGVNLAPEDNHAEAVPILGVTAYYDRYWSDRWSSSVGFSMNDADPTNQQAATEFDTGKYASINLLYTPNPELLFGLEGLYGEHEDVSGNIGRDYRTQFTMKHKFSAGY